MAKTEPLASRADQRSSGGSVYDGFISYSHAADDLLAPRLQAGLQRFAKPWWKRRALRIFRDESSLSANPHLWSSITEALDSSEWFVLLLSPDAAQSPWVNQEIEYWRGHGDPERILPVLTGGEFNWNGIDVSGDAVPDNLRGAYAEEPRWVDLRFAREEDQLDLKNPGFSNAVADIASALRGVPKDELESEEVKQHRRTMRTAWAAGIALVALVLVAVGFAFQANQNAAQARAGALASAALAALDGDPELAVLLSIQSLQTASTNEGASSLAASVQAHRTLFELEPGDSPFARGAISGDGSRVLYVPVDNAAELYNTDDPSSPIWSVPVPAGREFGLAAFADDGKQPIVFEQPAFHQPGFQLPAEPGRLRVLDAATGVDDSTFELPACTLPLLPRAGTVNLSQPLFAFKSPSQDGYCSQTQPPQLLTVDLETGESEIAADTWDIAWSTLGDPTWSGDGSRYSHAQGFGGAVVDAATGEEVMELPRGHSTLNGDGSLILAGNDPLELWNVDDQVKIREYAGNPNIAAFSPDETMIYTGDADGSMVVYDAESGRELIRLRGQGSEAVFLSMSDDQDLMASGSVDGTLRVWNIGSLMIGDAGLPDLVSTGELFFMPIESSAQHVALKSFQDLQTSSFETTLYDAESLAHVADISGAVHAISPDGTVAAMQWFGDTVELSDDETGRDIPGGRFVETGLIQLVDIASGERLMTMEGPCQFLDRSLDHGPPLPGDECGEFPESWMDYALDMSFSPDGGRLAMSGIAGNTSVWDTASGEIVWAAETEAGERFPNGSGLVSFAPDGSWLATAWLGENNIRIFETETWTEIAIIDHPQSTFISVLDVAPDGSLLLAGDNLHDVMVIDTAAWTLLEPLSGQQGNFMKDIDISPDGRLVATAGFDGEAWVWNLETREVIRKWASQSGRIESVEFLDNETLLIVPLVFPEAPNAVAVTLNEAKQLAYARSTLTRTFTDDECRTYAIDPCPSLVEMRDG